VEKLVYEPEPGIRLPALLYVPPGEGRRPAAVMAHGRGKAAAHREAEQLAKGGSVVLSIDARGFGETQSADSRGGSDWPRYFGNYHAAMTALLTGKPLVAMRAEDISRAGDLLRSRGEVDGSRISVVGIEGGAVPALYAAALDERFSGLTAERMLASYESVVRRPIHRNVFEHVVQGALRHYDLPALARWMGPRTVRIVDAVDPLGRPLPAHEVKLLYPAAEVVRTRPEPVSR
jgi:cephalosporin-C deacetylase-like acetyl esterase